jgi:D-alanine-D-alanine ligase
LKIAVLAGGTSAERPVSLQSGRQVFATLVRLGHDVEWWDVKADIIDAPSGAVSRALVDIGGRTELYPDVVFIALHGPDGEDGTVQGYLDVLGIPYTGSKVLASSLAMDKVRAKTMFAASGIPVAAHLVFGRDDISSRSVIRKIEQDLGLPCVVKPVRQGSSFGTSVVKDIGDLPKALRLAAKYDTELMVEEFISGREITVACIGTGTVATLPVVEIVTESGFFDYTSKYATDDTAATEIVPADLEASEAEEAANLALECHSALGCHGYSRTDMIVSEHGIYVLETNTLPGMTERSLLPKAAGSVGMSFDVLVERIVQLALGD